MRLVQFTTAEGARRVGRVDAAADTLNVLAATDSVYRLALDAIAAGRSLADLIGDRSSGERGAYAETAADERLLPPIDHPTDPAHCLVTGTGLSHLGSADARDKMHQKMAAEGEAALTDSMRMFQWGLDGGKPAPGQTGVQPEWFYKGDGSIVVAPGQALAMPDFALDGGEESEVVGLYVIAPDGTPWRVGFALGNEFSDHVMERQNYLYLAHSKLRHCAFGPELLLGALPADLSGTARVLRGDRVLWEEEFLSGEDNMSHAVANLERHHFKYPLFRRPGDVHCHFFGTATLSFSAGVKVEPGDVFEIACEAFGRPLRNPLAVVPAPGREIRVL
jgi:hypothetical protein